MSDVSQLSDYFIHVEITHCHYCFHYHVGYQQSCQRCAKYPVKNSPIVNKPSTKLNIFSISNPMQNAKPLTYEEKMDNNNNKSTHALSKVYSHLMPSVPWIGSRVTMPLTMIKQLLKMNNRMKSICNNSSKVTQF